MWTVFPSFLFISLWVKRLIVLYIVVVSILHIDFIVLLLLILSSDIELNPGPVTGRNRQ